MKPKTRLRIEKVKQLLREGIARQVVVCTASREFGIAPRTVDYYVTCSYRELALELSERKILLETMRKEEIGIAKKRLLCDTETDAFLADIIRGERKKEKAYAKGGVVKLAPDVAEVIKAIKMYYKRSSSG